MYEHTCSLVLSVPHPQLLSSTSRFSCLGQGWQTQLGCSGHIPCQPQGVSTTAAMCRHVPASLYCNSRCNLPHCQQPLVFIASGDLKQQIWWWENGGKKTATSSSDSEKPPELDEPPPWTRSAPQVIRLIPLARGRAGRVQIALHHGRLQGLFKVPKASENLPSFPIPAQTPPALHH